MLNYDKLSRKPLLFRSFTGLQLSEFDFIYHKIESKYPKYEINSLSKRDRIRNVGGGRHFKHDIKNRFLMPLVYYKLYITNSLTGFLFDLDQSNVSIDIQYLEPLVKSSVPIPSKLYKETKRLRTIKEVY